MSEAFQPEQGQEKQTPDEIAADIEATRDRLADNLDALTDKLDVKSQAKGAVHDATERVQEAVGGVKDKVAGAAGSASAGVGSATGAAVTRSRTLLEKFVTASLPVQAAIVAVPVALVVTLIIRRARS